MNNVTKTNKGVKTLIIIIIIALIGACGFLVYNKYIKKSDTGTKETKKEEVKVRKLDESKDYVYSLYSGEFYKIPTINIDTEDARNMNEEIKKFSNTDNLDKYNSNDVINYYSYTNDNIISVALINSVAASDYLAGKFFNINNESGNIMTNEEILSIKGVTVIELRKKILEIYESKKSIANDKKQKVSNSANLDGDYTVYEANKIKIEELNENNVVLFLNDKKELCVYFGEFQAAGSVSLNVIYNIDKKEYAKYHNMDVK